MSVRACAMLNAVLAAVLAGLVAAGWFLRADPARPNAEFLPDMAHSPRYNAFAPNPVFPDGPTLQAPVPGTIARGHMPLHYTASPQDAIRAGEELANPYAHDNVNALQRGQTVFGNFCQECHGSSGAGMGPVAQRGFPPPPSLLAAHALGLKDGQIFHILTYGQNNMPSYAGQLSRDDRWKVIVYVRSLQAKAPAAVASAGTTNTGVRP